MTCHLLQYPHSSRYICYTIRKACAAAMTPPQLFEMSINNTDSQYPLLVRAAPAILHILDGIEMLHNDPELITFLRSLDRDGTQQSPIQFQAQSMDDPIHGQRTRAGDRPRRRNMQPCGTCSSIKVKVRLLQSHHD